MGITIYKLYEWANDRGLLDTPIAIHFSGYMQDSNVKISTMAKATSMTDEGWHEGGEVEPCVWLNAEIEDDDGIYFG